MTPGAVPIEQWPERLQRSLDAGAGLLKRLTVLRQTDSTQEAARRTRANAGEVIVAWRQTSGRGRLGRPWADTAEAGVAVTIVVHPDQPERRAVATAVGVAWAIEQCGLARRIGIKWPNDIVVDGRKLAGILIEQDDRGAFIGVGVNVSQTTWPGELERRAVSLAQLGLIIDRLDVIERLLINLQRSLVLDDRTLAEEYLIRDALCGHVATFSCGGTVVTGLVCRVDPLRGLAVRTADGDVWLPAATTSVVAYELPRINDAAPRMRGNLETPHDPDSSPPAAAAIELYPMRTSH